MGNSGADPDRIWTQEPRNRSNFNGEMILVTLNEKEDRTCSGLRSTVECCEEEGRKLLTHTWGEVG